MAASYDIIYGGMKIPYLTNEYYYDDTVLYDIYFYIQYIIINILLYYDIYSMIPPASKTKTKKISFNIQAWRSYRKVVLGS